MISNLNSFEYHFWELSWTFDKCQTWNCLKLLENYSILKILRFNKYQNKIHSSVTLPFSIQSRIEVGYETQMKYVITNFIMLLTHEVRLTLRRDICYMNFQNSLFFRSTRRSSICERFVYRLHKDWTGFESTRTADFESWQVLTPNEMERNSCRRLR